MDFLRKDDVMIMALGMWHPYSVILTCMASVMGCTLIVPGDCRNDDVFINTISTYKVLVVLRWPIRDRLKNTLKPMK